MKVCLSFTDRDPAIKLSAGDHSMKWMLALALSGQTPVIIRAE
jgi:hypothetical protein